MGRPSKYTQKIADEICERLSKGEPLAVICRDKGMPDRSIVHDWKHRYKDFSQRFARAKEDGFEALAEECLRIAHDETNDWVLTKRGVVLNESAVSRARLQVETHLKLLAKWYPKKYGDKIEHEVAGELDVVVKIGGIK